MLKFKGYVWIDELMYWYTLYTNINRDHREQYLRNITQLVTYWYKKDKK